MQYYKIYNNKTNELIGIGFTISDIPNNCKAFTFKKCTKQQYKKLNINDFFGATNKH